MIFSDCNTSDPYCCDPEDPYESRCGINAKCGSDGGCYCKVGFKGNPFLECSSKTFIKTFFLYNFFYLIGSCDPTDPFGCVQYDCIPGDPSCYK